LLFQLLRAKRKKQPGGRKHRSAVETDLRAAMRGGKTLSLQDVMAQAKRKKEVLPVTIRLASEDIARAGIRSDLTETAKRDFAARIRIGET
jgi:hypothetical protein